MRAKTIAAAAVTAAAAAAVTAAAAAAAAAAATPAHTSYGRIQATTHTLRQPLQLQIKNK